MYRRCVWVLSKAVISAMLVLWATSAWGALCPIGTFESDLTVPNSPNVIGTGPYGAVCVSLINSNTATIQFIAYSGFNFTDSHSVGVEGNFTMDPSTIATDCSGCSPQVDSGNLDGFGSYTAEVKLGNSSSTDRASLISFNVNNTGTAWAS